MKIILLLFLVSCATVQPNCVVLETGKYLGSVYSILECSRIPICRDADIACLNSTKCSDVKDDNGKYNCARRE